MAPPPIPALRSPPGGRALPAGPPRPRWAPGPAAFQCLPGLHGLVGGIAQAAADPQGVVVPQEAPDLPDDHGHAVGGKPHRLGRVKVVDGLMSPMHPT